MTTDATVSLDEIDAAAAKVAPGLTLDEQRLAVAVYRLLAHGQPVTVDTAAATAGIPSAQAEQTIRSWAAVFRDDRNQIIGFWGLALERMPHRLLSHAPLLDKHRI
jgi:hypothetical protein